MKKKGDQFNDNYGFKNKKVYKRKSLLRFIRKYRTRLAVFLMLILILCSASIYFKINEQGKQNNINKQIAENTKENTEESIVENTHESIEEKTKESTEENRLEITKESSEENTIENTVETPSDNQQLTENSTSNSYEGDATKETIDNSKELDTSVSENSTDTGLETEQNSASTDEAQETFNQHNKKPVKVRGIYISGPRAGSDKYMKDLIDLVDTTELNSMVIDIKNDLGEITYNMDLSEVKDLKANRNYIKNVKELVKKLKEKNIYLIARVVAFKDPILAEGKQDLSIRMKDGSVFRDKNGDSWVNPYKKEVWDYLISIAKEAGEIGFDEIQFDYIRFSTDPGIKNADFGKDAQGKTKMEAITEFTKYACENLKPLGVYVSADVFGTIIDSETDAKIVGQDYNEMANYLDYICPMIYPSHYANGSYGITHPDLDPYQLIYKALEKSQEVLKPEYEDSDKAVVRSWLQDFTATWLDNHQAYGAKEIREQIQAVYDAGYDEWILWNGSNNYTRNGLLKE